MHLLHPIFGLGRDENAGKSPYQIAMSKAEQAGNEDELDVEHHRSRSLRRKASMKRRLETGHSLSDTHSNTWPYDDSEDTDDAQKDKAIRRAEAWERRQTNRRRVVHDRIEKGKALSDSTGGNWSEDTK